MGGEEWFKSTTERFMNRNWVVSVIVVPRVAILRGVVPKAGTVAED